MLNKIILIGRLTQDPELRYTPAEGIAVATFSIAVERGYKNQQGEKEVDFIRIVAWRKLAETAANNLNKGRLVAVDGRLQIRKYEDREGIKRTIAEVVANGVYFLDWPKDKNGQQGGQGGYSNGGKMDFVDDDVPF